MASGGITIFKLVWATSQFFYDTVPEQTFFESVSEPDIELEQRALETHFGRDNLNVET